MTLNDEDGNPVAEASLPLPAGNHRVRFLQDVQWSFQAGAEQALGDFRGLLRAKSSAALATALLRLRPGAFALTRTPR